MASRTPHPNKRSLGRVLRGKALPRNKPWALCLVVPTGNLRGEGQEHLVQAPFREEARHEMGAALNQHQAAVAGADNRIKN